MPSWTPAALCHLAALDAQGAQALSILPPDAGVSRPLPVSAPRGSEYAMLSRQVRQAGLLAARPSYYAWKITLTAAAVVAGWSMFVLVGDSWWQLGVAAFLAVAFGQ